MLSFHSLRISAPVRNTSGQFRTSIELNPGSQTTKRNPINHSVEGEEIDSRESYLRSAPVARRVSFGLNVYGSLQCSFYEWE